MEPRRPAEVVSRIVTTDDLELLLAILPERIRRAVPAERRDDLLEIVLDFGRAPEARYTGAALFLGEARVSREEIRETAARVGAFAADNRAGIEGTLHRIAALRSRRGEIVGLTCRVGRAVTGTIAIVKDLFTHDASVLLLGRPGVGKTTLLREAARVLADDEGKRVVVVDTSNEIAGDGDVPHPGIGHARRLQVPSPDRQHAVMIEAVENHMPEVVVIDEIGTHEEALAARTIAERGVQLIATAHGTSLANLVANPTLSDLVGGIQAVTLGDEEARRRRTRKTVLERKAPPAFDVLLEIQDRYRFAVHPDVGGAVDLILEGRAPIPEIRSRRPDGTISVERVEPARPSSARRRVDPGGRPRRIFPYAISIDRLERAIRRLGVPSIVTSRLSEADVLITLRSHERRQPAKILEAERRGIPIRVVRSNTQAQIERALADLFADTDAQDLAIQDAEDAVALVLAENRPVDLEPRSGPLRRLQHLIAEERGLLSESRGHDPHRSVTFYPPLAPERPC